MANEKYIWDYLMETIGNAYGAAAVMGNLMAESSLNPTCATGLNKIGYKGIVEYVAHSDAGYHDFVYDGVAFGIAQWRYHTRKQGLLNLSKKNGTSVGDLDTQLEYLWKEMIGYKTVWNAVLNAKDVRTASDIVMLKYEKPATTTEAAKQKRANYGQKFYDRFATETGAERVTTGDDVSEKAPATGAKKTGGKKMVRAKANVNVRMGDSRDYPRFDVLSKGKEAEWVATAENGWFAIRMRDQVGWVSNEFAEVV